jgi:hypothetical protein
MRLNIAGLSQKTIIMSKVATLMYPNFRILMFADKTAVRTRLDDKFCEDASHHR